SFPLPHGTSRTGNFARRSCGRKRWIVPSPPNTATTSATDRESLMSQCSTCSPTPLSRSRSLSCAPGPRMARAFICGGTTSCEAKGSGLDEFRQSPYFGRLDAGLLESSLPFLLCVLRVLRVENAFSRKMNDSWRPDDLPDRSYHRENW